MPEMFAWYIDNNSYVTKEKVDSLIVQKDEAVSSNVPLRVIIKKNKPSLKNPGAPVTGFRNAGLLGKNEEYSDALKLYRAGIYPFSCLLFDLISKRNVAKEDNIPIKPLVCICKVFSLMNKLEIPREECFLTTAEVYEYLSVLEDYSGVTEELVHALVNNRVYSREEHIPDKRVQVTHGVYLSSLFNMMSDTPVFLTGLQESIICDDVKYIELIDYIAAAGETISIAPITDGNNNSSFYDYCMDINNGIMEIVPETPLKAGADIPKNATKDIFEYLFGVTGAKAIKWDEYFTEDCAGMYRIFYPIRWIALMKVFLQNKTTGEHLLDYIMQTDDYTDCLKEGKLMIELPFENTGHSDLSELTESCASTARKARRKTTKTEGTNILLYGVPGCGKSHEIKTNYCKDKKYMERVVFHPDYTYSDFIGQILPKTDGATISYPFTEGPFTTILRKAYDDPDNMYFLVIEEINRGNAPAIFGEVFQLLDRENGESEYGITNFDIARCVFGEGEEETEIKVPGNLTILATMNTADQNVFTLDTAFKRRWTMRSIENNIPACGHASDPICGTAVTWGVFATKINDTIIDFGKENLSSEDNRLGAYFVKAEDLKDQKIFAEKVLMYLWNDAFKYDRDKVFKPEYRTLEELLKGFETHKFGVFASALGFADTPVSTATAGDLSEDEYLVNKNPEMVKLYGTIRDMVQVQVPNLTTYTTASKAYVGMSSADNKKKNFAEFSIKKEHLSLEIEKPDDAALQALGEDIPYNGSHDHYFRINVTAESNLDLVVAAIVASYERLK